MRNQKLLTTTLVFCLLAVASLATADVPQMINYQGRLTDGAGTALDTTVSMEFAIYDDSTGGVLKWSEVHPSVTVTEGNFSIILGSVTAIDDSVFNQPDRWLGITIGIDPELSSRTRLVSSGYSHRVSTVDGASGGTISNDVEISGNLGVGMVNDSAHLYVDASTPNQAGIYVRSTQNTPGVFAYHDGTGHGMSIIKEGVDGEAISVIRTDNGRAVEISSAPGGDSEFFVIEGDGRVGIGTNNPTEALEVDGTVYSTSGGFKFPDSTIQLTAASGGGWTISDTNMYSAVSGNVGIGTTIPLRRLTVKPSQDIPQLFLEQDNQTDGWVFHANESGDLTFSRRGEGGAGVETEHLRIKQNSNVGIGTNNPTEALEVEGTVYSTSGGFKFPDGTTQSTAASGGSWLVTDSVLHTSHYWGIARGGAGNVHNGDSSQTTTNWGIASTTGVSYQPEWGQTVGGGRQNSAFESYTTVAGGFNNTADSCYSTVGGGYINWAYGNYSTIGGGSTNNAMGIASTVSGGESNDANGSYATVAGGDNNEANGLYATVAGGENNAAYGVFTTIAGGDNNYTEKAGCTIGGGRDNSATGIFSTVSGGYNNDCDGDYSYICGGQNGSAKGLAAAVLGGMDNEADGDYSVACGNGAKALHDGSFVYADASGIRLESTAPNQFLVRATGGVTILTDSKSGSGVVLRTGSSSWAVGSDRNLKENIEPVDSKALLDKLTSLPIGTWNYKAQDESIRHIGPMAQDFSAAFGVGEDDKHIATIDADGVALAAIQALHSENQDLASEVAQLKENMAQLQALVEVLMAECDGETTETKKLASSKQAPRVTP